MADTHINQDFGDYIASDYVSHGKFMDDDAYSQALDSLVIACVDIAPMYNGKMLLGKRTRHPQADWWIFGGRILAGEGVVESAQRLMRDEMNLDISSERFSYLTSFAGAWGKRAHEPKDHGTHTVSLTWTVLLTSQDLKAMSLNDEYSEFKLVSLSDLLGDVTYHPALHQCGLALEQISTQRY